MAKVAHPAPALEWDTPLYQQASMQLDHALELAGVPDFVSTRLRHPERALILTLPVVMPVLKSLGVDMIWFGVVAVLIIQMGILSPPVGLNVFIVKGLVPDVPMYTIFRGIWPFWYAMGLLIVLLMIFPQLALFLPNTMFR